MTNEPTYTLGQLKVLAKTAKKNRVNRAYYKHFLDSKDMKEAGFIQSKDKCEFDRITVNKSENEWLRYYGVDQKGSSFTLNLSIVSLFCNPRDLDDESNWRLAKVHFKFFDFNNKTEYEYSHQELIDYDDKHRNPNISERNRSNVYKIGSMTLEIVLPFSLSRIVLNGNLKKKNDDGTQQVIMARLSISTHPTCDKLDYRYRISSSYLADALHRSLRDDSHGRKNAKNLLKNILENRMDQPMMFHLHLKSEDKETIRMIMWGAKVKRVENPREVLVKDSRHQIIDEVCFWSECGHIVHLSSLRDNPNILYGMIHNSYDYASHFYDSSIILPPEGPIRLPRSILNLPIGTTIILKGYKTKEYKLEILGHGETPPPGGLLRVKINNFEGWAMKFSLDIKEELEFIQKQIWVMDIHDTFLCQKVASENLLGGKGHSLVRLNQYLSETSCKSLYIDPDRELACRDLSVPRGFIITSIGHHYWLRSDENIEKILEGFFVKQRTLMAKSLYTNPLTTGHVTLAERHSIMGLNCEDVQKDIRPIGFPISLRNRIEEQLKKTFGEDFDHNGNVFAVRSSAVGEDSSETSAAGQMKTFLNVSARDIYRAIIDCWVSQYSIEAIMYKAQNGLDLNWPMAIVVQEVVVCHSAGVATTCNPLDGDRSHLEITGCFGSGEKVVAGEKTDIVEVELKELPRSNKAGSKIGHLKEADVNSAPGLLKFFPSEQPCSITQKHALSIANLLLWIRNTDPMPDREVEWGITLARGDPDGFNMHLFQSRPLTNLDRLTTHEIDFEMDSGLSGPLELVSRANIGEVMPGSIAPLTSSFFMQLVQYLYDSKSNDVNYSFKPCSSSSWGSHARIPTIVLTDTNIMINFAGGTSEQNKKALEVMAGIESDWITDQSKFFNLMNEKTDPNSTHKPMTSAHHVLNDAGLNQTRILNSRRTSKKYKFQEDMKSLQDWLELFQSSIEKPEAVRRLIELVELDIKKLFNKIQSQISPLVEAWRVHNEASKTSMHMNKLCIENLRQQSYYSHPDHQDELMPDFSLLIRGGEPTESGDISHFLDRIVESIVKENRLQAFNDLPLDLKYEFLTDICTKNGESPKLFKKFMEKNGHRGFKEFDLATLAWQDDPSYVVQSLDSRAKSYSKERTTKALEARKNRDIEEAKKVREIMGRIDITMFYTTTYFINAAKRGVARREEGKSHLIAIIHRYRRAFRHLGSLLCLAGRLPTADLIYFLSMEEIHTMVEWSRERPADRIDLARLISKARTRKQRTRVLDRYQSEEATVPLLKFYEHIYTVVDELPRRTVSPMVPDGRKIKGLTSCAGLVTAPARVIRSLNEMSQIQAGEILVTHSIDVSWTVYFFALAGIVTELGGIVSHGAVIAREYGIPTLCSATGACSRIRNGQMITLDANKGCCYASED